MAKLQPFRVTNFSGGIRNDKSDFEKLDTELVSVVNFDLDEQGNANRRLGSHQLGDTLSGSDNMENSFYFQRIVGGAVPAPFLLVNTDSATTTVRKLAGTHLASAITTASTTISLIDASGFSASGSIEIEGDLVAYTGKTGNNLTTASGVSSSHAVGAAIHQWSNISATTINGSRGVSYTPLNNVVYIQAHDNGGYTWDGTNLTAVADGDEPNGRFATTYRQRIFTTQFISAASARVFFSDSGDSTSWTAGNSFDVEDSRGEIGTGFRVLNDELLILKTNSFFAYNQVTLKQRNQTVGSYNNKTHQEIGGLMYTFCPQGIFRTDGSLVSNIGEPIKDWIKDFRPKHDASDTIVTNTFSAQIGDKYLLYVGDVTTPGSYSDVVLIFDTIRENWTVVTGFTNFQHLIGFNTYFYGGAIQSMKGLFGGNDNGQYYKMYSKSYIDSAGTSRNSGASGDLLTDLLSDTGVIISSELTTQLYDQETPNIYKNYSNAGLRILAENIGFNISFRIENEKGISDWKPLGITKRTNQRFELPKKTSGYRFGVKVTHADSNIAPSFSGFILEDVEITNKTKLK